MKYPALIIANYFLEKAKQNGQRLTPMKLIKLVYLAHGWNLALRQTPLISEPVEAWQYGPVIPSVYHCYKKFGNEEITELASTDSNQYCKLKNDEITLKILDKVWDVYGQYSATQLSNMTHEKGSPWDIAWNDQCGRTMLSHPISNDSIRIFFSEQANHNQATASP